MKNNTTTWTGIGFAIFGVLTALAALPYQLGELAVLIPPKWKETVTAVGLGAALVLKIWNSIASADAKQVNKLTDRVDHIDPGSNI